MILARDRSYRDLGMPMARLLGDLDIIVIKAIP
jgi:hypothetical protein